MQQIPRGARKGDVDGAGLLGPVDAALLGGRGVACPHCGFRIENSHAAIADTLTEQITGASGIMIEIADLVGGQTLPRIVACEVVDAHGKMPVDRAVIAVRTGNRTALSDTVIGKLREDLMLAVDVGKRRDKTCNRNRAVVHQRTDLGLKLVDARPVKALH